MKLFEITVTALVVALATPCLITSHAQQVSKSEEQLPGYSPAQKVSGTIRIWGDDAEFVEPLVRSWEEGFRRHQPNARFENRLRGNRSAIGGLYTGAADLALMGREIWPTEIDGYEQVLGHKPVGIILMTGSVDAPHYEAAAVIFVHQNNPITKLTLAQLDAIFGADHRRGLNIVRKWGDLGLTGEWVDKPIHLYGYQRRSDIAHFFEQTALAGSEKWNCDLREFTDGEIPRQAIQAGQLILEQLAKDQYGIAISSLAYTLPMVKALSLAEVNGGNYYPATFDFVLRRQYPLTRTASVYFERSAGKLLDPKIKEFLSYLISEEGQEAVSRASRYLPLTPKLAQAARRTLQ